MGSGGMRSGRKSPKRLAAMKAKAGEKDRQRGEVKTFTRDGLAYNAVNKAAVDAVLKAPVGAMIEYKHHGVGSFDRGSYKITGRGGGRKQLTPVNSDGTHERGYVLTRSNVNKHLGRLSEIKITSEE